MTEKPATRASEAPHGPHTPPGGPGPHPAPANASQGRTAGRVVTGEEVPQDVLDAAQRGYSMHGAGLTANIVAAAWPAIEKHIRDRTPTGDLRERLANTLPCPICHVPSGWPCGAAGEVHVVRVEAADAVLPVVEDETAALRKRAERAEALAARYRMQVDDPDSLLVALDEAGRQRDEALAALTTHAAEAHRRKWAHQDDNQAAFDALHRLGNEIIASRDRLLAALKPEETR